jgi:hypothetical protein
VETAEFIPDGPETLVEFYDVPVAWPVEAKPHPRFERPLEVSVRQAALLTSAPWVRAVGNPRMEVRCQGWKFPQPPDQSKAPPPPAEEAAPRTGRIAKPLPLSALPREAQEEIAGAAAASRETSLALPDARAGEPAA